jgi:hypothetical protein
MEECTRFRFPQLLPLGETPERNLAIPLLWKKWTTVVLPLTKQDHRKEY